MTIEERLEKLERELACTSSTLKEIRANCFILEDEGGKPRATLRVVENRAELAMVDEKGKLRVGLVVVEDQAGFYLGDEKGELSAFLSLAEDGPGLYLVNDKGKVTWSAP